MHVEIISVQDSFSATDINSLSDLINNISGPMPGSEYKVVYVPISIKVDTIDKHAPSEVKPTEYTDIFTTDGDMITAAMPYSEFKELIKGPGNVGWTINKTKDNSKIEIKWNNRI
jgi:hypothetical protein